ncbi:hypothetical protein ACWDKQ_05740 [Saccharopolyspora sp. NPDC000995]
MEFTELEMNVISLIELAPYEALRCIDFYAWSFGGDYFAVYDTTSRDYYVESRRGNVITTGIQKFGDAVSLAMAIAASE